MHSAFSSLTLDAVGGNTLDDVLLEQDEHDDDRQQRDHRHGEQAAVVVVAVGVQIEVERQGDGVILRAGHKNQRLEEVLPDPVEGKDGGRDDGGLDDGDHDLEQDARLGAAVQHGGLVQVAGDAPHVLSNEEDEEPVAEHPGQRHRDQRVRQAQVLQDDILGHYHHLGGDHHGHDHAAEPEAGTFEFEPGERVGLQQGAEDAAHHRHHCHDGGVCEKAPERDARDPLKAGHVVGDGGPLFGDEAPRIVEHGVVGLERTHQQPQQRVDYDEPQQAGKDVEEHRLCLCAFLTDHCVAPSLPFVVDPGPLALEEQQRRQADDGHQDPCQRAGIAHVEVGEGRPVQIQHIGQGAVHGAAVGDDVALGKNAEAVDDLLDEVEEDGGGEHGHGDLPELCEAGRAVHGGRLIQGLGDLLEARQKDQHTGAELPHAHQDDDEQGGVGVAQQRELLLDAKDFQQAHQDALVAEDLLPDHRDGDGAAHDGGDIVRRPCPCAFCSAGWLQRGRRPAAAAP